MQNLNWKNDPLHILLLILLTLVHVVKQTQSSHPFHISVLIILTLCQTFISVLTLYDILVNGNLRTSLNQKLDKFNVDWIWYTSTKRIIVIQCPQYEGSYHCNAFCCYLIPIVDMVHKCRCIELDHKM